MEEVLEIVWNNSSQPPRMEEVLEIVWNNSSATSTDGGIENGSCIFYTNYIQIARVLKSSETIPVYLLTVQ